MSDTDARIIVTLLPVLSDMLYNAAVIRRVLMTMTPWVDSEM